MNTEAVNQEYQTVNLSQLTESLSNPRKTFDHKALNEMAESIRAVGLLQPTLYFSATRSQGCGWSCLRPSEMRFLAGSTLRIRASTLSPTLRTSAGLLTRPQEMSATCNRASTPPISTKARCPT